MTKSAADSRTIAPPSCHPRLIAARQQHDASLTRDAAIQAIAATVTAQQHAYVYGNGYAQGLIEKCTRSAKLITFRGYCEKHQNDWMRPELRMYRNLFEAMFGFPTGADLEALGLWVHFVGNDFTAFDQGLGPARVDGDGKVTRPPRVG